MTRKLPRLTDQLRHSIADCGISRYRLAKETGVGQSSLALFCNGKRGLSMEAIDAIGEHLRLRIIVDSMPRTGEE